MPYFWLGAKLSLVNDYKTTKQWFINPQNLNNHYISLEGVFMVPISWYYQLQVIFTTFLNQINWTVVDKILNLCFDFILTKL